ncbi:MAG: hypothetical protein R3D71_08645 [Rickettsiales bacterium]
MAQAIDHNIGSGAGTVAKEAVKGAVITVATVAAVGALLVGGVAAIAGALVGLEAASIAGLAVGGGVVGGVGGLVTSSIAGPGVGVLAGLGGAVGAAKGGFQVGDEKAAYRSVANSQNRNIEATIAQAQQQAYMAGAQDGQRHLIEQIQQSQQAEMARNAHQQQNAHARQVTNNDGHNKLVTSDVVAPHADNHGNGQSFADRVGGSKKNSITPEAIAEQRKQLNQQQHTVA